MQLGRCHLQLICIPLQIGSSGNRPIDVHFCVLLQARLEQDIAHKQQLREQVSQQLEGDMMKFKEMEREAAALIAKTRHTNSKLMVSVLHSVVSKHMGVQAS